MTISVVVTETEINASVQEASPVSVSASQSPISVSISQGGGGTTDHAALTNLDYANANHTGFQATLTPDVDYLIPATIASTYPNVSVGAPANGLSMVAGQIITIALAASGVTGALSGTDWDTFNNKQAALGYTPLNPANNLSDVAAQQTALNNITAVAGATNEYVLTKDTGTGNATWKVAAGGSSLPVVDTTAIVKGSADATKLFRIEVDGFTTGQTRVFTPPDADLTITGGGTLALGGYTLTIPATGTVALGTGTANYVGYWAGTNTLTGAATLTYNPAASPNLLLTAANAAHVPLTIKLAASHSANAFTITNSSDTILTSINQKGVIEIDIDADANSFYCANFHANMDSSNRTYVAALRTTIELLNKVSSKTNDQSPTTWRPRVFMRGNSTALEISSAMAFYDGYNTSSATRAYGYRAYTPVLNDTSTIGTYYAFYADNITGASTNYSIYTNTGLVHFGDNVDLASGKNITLTAGNLVFGTATGTKIGTGTTQKIGFWNATPAVQPAAVADATGAGDVVAQLNTLLARLRTIGIIAT